MITRAKIKPIRELGPDYFCCNDSLQFYERALEMDLVFEVDTDQVRVVDTHCPACKNKFGPRKHMTVIDGKANGLHFQFVAIDCINLEAD